jgi:hypothetical protein
MERAIERIMRTCGPRQDWLAERMGISESHLSLLLNRKRNWTALRKRQAVAGLRAAARCIMAPGEEVEAYFEEDGSDGATDES